MMSILSRKLILASLVAVLSVGEMTSALAQSRTKTRRSSKATAVQSKSKKRKAPAKKSAIAPARKSQASSSRQSSSELSEALALAKRGRYQEASVKLFQLGMSPRFRDKRMQIKYILGLMLYQMKFNQLSAFQFISVVKQNDSKYLKQSLEKLSLAADQLGDDTLLNYAISRIQVDDFPRVHRDMLYYRVGEFQMRGNQLEQAAQSFARVSPESLFYSQAKYLQGLAYADLKQEAKAMRAFDDLLDSRRGKGITDAARVSALMGKARVYYQGKQWDDAIETYREVPRDTDPWHDTLFESSWAMLRSGRFRSALSNFQSLHSTYYEDAYLPESLLLRSIVYLYICKYDEMEKVLNLYNRIYRPIYKNLVSYLGSVNDPVTYYNEVTNIVKDFSELGDKVRRSEYRIPFVVGRKIAREGDYQRTHKYIIKLTEELKRVNSMPPQWKNSAIGKYAERILQNRLQKARSKAGRLVRAHMLNIKEELFDLMEQEGFIRYEMINGRKESIKKRVAGKSLPTQQIDQETARDYYVQNGYEYYPFRGEYWLDELGNYHYVGTQSCD